MKLAALSLLLAVPVALVACDDAGPAVPPEPTAARNQPDAAPSPDRASTAATSGPNTPAASPTQPPSDPTVASFLGIEAPKPVTWQWQPPRNAMVTANYTVPAPAEAEGANAAHVSIYFFGKGMGGSVEDNIERWKNQFRSPDGYEVTPEVSEFQVDGMDVTFVELAGEWMQMNAAAFTRDQLFLAAIVDAPAGRIFIRFAGDQRTVEPNREAFMEMIHGMRNVNNDQVDDPGAPYDLN